MVAAVLDALFLLVLFGVLVAYGRNRDPVQCGVALIFVAMSGFFVRNLIAQLGIGQPTYVTGPLMALLLAQPVLTVRLLGRLRPLPRTLLPALAVSCLLAQVVIVTQPRPLPLWALLAVTISMTGGGVIAAMLLATEAGRRPGSPRARLRIAAGATATFAVAFTVSVIGSFVPSAQDPLRTSGRAVGLVAALGYAVAFAPPGWLRRLWSVTAVYRASQRLLQAPATDGPAETWQHYMDDARDVCGVDGVVLLLRTDDDAVVEAACVGLAVRPGPVCTAAELDRLLSRPQPIPVDEAAGHRPALALRYANRIDARFVHAVPIDLPNARGALLLLNRYPHLFTADDVRLLADLAAQAGVIAQRGTMMAEQERLGRELAASVAALTVASQAKSDFLASMSHELRTPLNAIIGFSDLMRGEQPSEDRRLVPAEWVDHVYTSGRHLLELINDVLDLTKVEAGRLDLKIEPLELAEAVGETVAAVRPLAVGAGLQLTVTVPAGLAVRADRIRLRQILYNLLSNAIKFTPAGGKVDVAASEAEPDLLFWVQDTGVGIALADQEAVFEQFRQVGSPAARQGGTGLGLALTRRLVEAQGGAIWLESELGRGARFVVRLPAARPAEPGPVEPVAPAGTGGILVIEDEPAAAELLRTYLEEAGYPVTVVSDGRTGLSVARRCAPAAVLLDLVLPGMDGWEVLRQFKLDAALRDIPVVIVTVVDEREVGLALGAMDYLVKPLDRDTLLRRLAWHGLLAPAKPGRPTTVLVIDDDAATLRLIDASLSPGGVDVVTTSTGTEALRLARTRRFDLIICDLIMPEMDGFTLIAALATNPATSGTPVLVITGLELTEPDKARLNGRILGVLHKGADLQAALRDWLSIATEPRPGAPGTTPSAGPTSGRPLTEPVGAPSATPELEREPAR
jgi:signal transduction histidine kinase/CheY-like chemotaxis protein